ncbi:ABC transporter permease subunit [Paenibacillus sp. LMG 31461]|uniref:ABC transporter permease subunit n=2 Tax=Paenibacillus TaxID=44249 RepID=A0ABX1X6E9_9BACL|nr:ABC transporter permease subunit [Paenibacillus plantarum]NOU64008.1 ABC transporter permease subunit [Paenibacillus plantarum]
MKRYKYIYMLAFPAALYFLVFKYVPMWGILLAFQEYSPFRGFWQSEWVGFQHFANLFASNQFWNLFRNTLLINLFGLVFYFPLPIVLSVMLNEVGRESIKRVIQSIVYLPHFLSWVIVVSFTYFFLSVDFGLVNKVFAALGWDKISFMSDPNYFWGLLTAQSIWKEIGWGTIIFLAAIAGVDPQLYEASYVDGAGRLRRIWHITLPAIRSTAIILLILRLGHMLDVGFEQVLLMQSPLVLPVAEVFDTYVYKRGVLSGELSYSIAVGLFKSVVGLLLVVSANQLAKRSGEEGLY